MRKLVVLFSVTMFLAVFALIGCNKAPEPPKPEEIAPVEEPAPEVSKPKPKPKPLPTVGNVSITVKDIWAKQPIKDAIVNVTVNEVMRVVKTNAAGKALFKNLPLGNYTFTVASPDGISDSDAITINVAVPRGETASRTVSLRVRL